MLCSQEAGFARAASVYIHVPFCQHKCHYCDFYSIVDTRDRQASFTRRLCRELAAIAPRAARPLRTIFVGGGTPSLLGLELWREVLACLHDNFDLTLVRTGKGEFTVECNPESASAELLRVLHAGGVNRVSIGAQSFDPRHLQTLERWHDPANVPRAVTLARDAGIGRVSIDLIHAVPGQSIDDLDHDLDRALALGLSHLSNYSLTYEPRTAMTARLQRGEFERADEDLEADMFVRVLARMRGAGLERYEVSNFAVPGEECRHNLAYWRQENWLAAGPSASGHLAGWRWKNTPRLDDYLAFDDDGYAPAVDIEPPDPRRALRERLWTGLRMSGGVDASDINRRASEVDAQIPGDLLACIDRHVRAGWVASESGRWRLTDAGFLLADRVARECMRAVGVT